MIRVWDPLVRAFHWALAASFAVAWLSSENWESLHAAAGYVAGALVALRVVWGFLGPRYARFAQFVRSPGHGDRLSKGDQGRFGAPVHRPQSGGRGDDRRPACRDGGDGGQWLAPDDRRLLGLACHAACPFAARPRRTRRWWSFISSAWRLRACAITRIWLAPWSSASSGPPGPAMWPDGIVEELMAEAQEHGAPFFFATDEPPTAAAIDDDIYSP